MKFVHLKTLMIQLDPKGDPKGNIKGDPKGDSKGDPKKFMVQKRKTIVEWGNTIYVVHMYL
jgi:hypothetical protein